MRRTFLAALAVFGIGMTVVGVAAPAAASAGPVAARAAQPAASIVHAGVDDFSFSSYDADFYLDTDDDGR